MAPCDIHIVLDRLRSAHNTGNIFRLAEAVGASGILACGYTPAPPHPKLAKTAMGADALVPCRSFPDAREAIRALRAEGYRIEARSRLGYRLLAVPDLVSPEAVQPGLVTVFCGRNYLYHPTLSSTNDQAK